MSSKHHEPRDEHKKPANDRENDVPTSPESQNDEPPSDAECVSEDVAVAAEGRALTAEAQLELLHAELAEAKAEISVLNDKYLRKLADDVNFRKRMAREKEDGLRFALASLLGDLIPVLDDFDRAVASAETVREYGILHDGIVLIRRQLGQLLENKYGLIRLESLGKPFDPNRHEAVAMELAGEIGEPMVAEEFLPGYGLHERVIRTAKVKVKMPGHDQGAARPDPDLQDSAGNAAPSGGEEASDPARRSVGVEDVGAAPETA